MRVHNAYAQDQITWRNRHTIQYTCILGDGARDVKRTIMSARVKELDQRPLLVRIGFRLIELDESARARMRPGMRGNLGIGEGQIVLLFSGKLSHRKGPELILQALKCLSSDVCERAAVVFLGSGQLAEELRRLAWEQPQVRVFFPDFQNQTQLSRYYHAADLLILPSRWGETWGLVVNEALRHGLPCVVSDAVGCAPDLVENGITGHTFESRSTHSLTSVLQRAFELIGRGDVRLSCRRKVSGYGIEDAAKGIAEAYNQVVRLQG